MPNYYKQIQGWSSFLSFYEGMVNKYIDGGHFVEVGVWKGRSSIFMLEYIVEKGANILFDVVDSWSEDVGSIGAVGEWRPGHHIFDEFSNHLEKSGMNKVINKVHKTTSLIASTFYLDNSLDFIFIDANHDGWECYNDICVWWPKLKIGGTIGGHDIAEPSVEKSVRRFALENNIKWTAQGGSGSIECWIIEK